MFNIVVEYSIFSSQQAVFILLGNIPDAVLTMAGKLYLQRSCVGTGSLGILVSDHAPIMYSRASLILYSRYCATAPIPRDYRCWIPPIITVFSIAVYNKIFELYYVP